MIPDKVRQNKTRQEVTSIDDTEKGGKLDESGLVKTRLTRRVQKNQSEYRTALDCDKTTVKRARQLHGKKNLMYS
jgi:hypothetical protein